MRVLLSAYACEPDRGSEPEVGWQRAQHMLAHADEVWVLTRANNQSVIEADPRSHAPGLHFLYYDLPRWALKLKKQPWFLPVFFTLWQWGAYRVALQHHREKRFDRVYHVTFASMQFGSLMGRLGIPFVIGPIASGDRVPMRLRRSMPIRGQAMELLRDLGIISQRYGPFSRTAFAAAERIYVATANSLSLIAPKWRSKATVQLAVAMDSSAARNEERRPPDFPRYLYAGNFLCYKGAHLAIRALAEVNATIPEATLTLAGDGPEEEWLRAVAKKCGAVHTVEFAGRVSRQRLIASLHTYTALVFPSLRDSGGMVVLEAFSQGLPVICLNLGGPGIIVNESCGIVVPTADAGEAQIVTRIANAMVTLGKMSSAELDNLSRGAIARANELSWTRLAACIAAVENRIPI
jgi:glycosyltransferase involved in cell wall biosynthesis